jgi:hypothetical protein
MPVDSRPLNSGACRNIKDRGPQHTLLLMQRHCRFHDSLPCLLLALGTLSQFVLTRHFAHTPDQ